MKINSSLGAMAGVALSALLGSASVTADDPFDKQKDAAEKRYEIAKENCEQLRGDDQDRCKEKAEADYTREIESIRQNPPGDAGSTGTPESDTDEMGNDNM